MKKPTLPNIFICIVMDLLGMATFGLPVFAEFADIVWAPVSAVIFYLLFGKKIGFYGGIINFIEEILPFADVIPTFTIAWFIRRNEIASLRIDK